MELGPQRRPGHLGEGFGVGRGRADGGWSFGWMGGGREGCSCPSGDLLLPAGDTLPRGFELVFECRVAFLQSKYCVNCDAIEAFIAELAMIVSIIQTMNIIAIISLIASQPRE